MTDLIERYFTEEYVEDKFPPDIYDSVVWKKVNVEIKDFSTGETIFEGDNLEFPDHYSQQACDIIASKYFFRDIDGKGTPETSLRQVVHRMAMFWTDALIDEEVISGEWLGDDRSDPYNFYTWGSEAEIFYDEIVYTLLHQMWAPNSPQWFNTGLGLAYGLKGESDDLYYCDEYGVHKSPDRYTRSQTSACFIIPVTDHLIGKNSITDHFVTETKLFKGGSGVGTNFSPIRAEGERLSSGGESSGVMSFLLGLDRNAGAIKSGGTTRRAAKMVILDVDHPDIEDFIDWKVHEEKKALDLISLGYSGGMTGEAYQTVSGQNSNNSVRVNKEFMDKILGYDPDPTWELKGRKDQTKNQIVNAHDLWNDICTAAWNCADPGIQFDDLYNEWHTAPNAGRINATNPCSEFAFIDNSACNLASINVLKFYDGVDYFDYGEFIHMVNLVQLVLEASIHWGQFPTEEVAENSYKYRPTGLGLTNLGALFLKMGYPYDSLKARRLAENIAGYMTAQSYATSGEIASVIGACEGYWDNENAFLDVLTMHIASAKNEGVDELFNDAYRSAANWGVRNMQTTVMAPTGTISLAMDCLSTGIEPFFSHKFYKKCSDGSVMEMTNPLAEEYVENVFWLADVKRYFDQHRTFLGCPDLTEEQQMVLATANEIDPKAHVDMMAAIQPMISGSISKTVNLPNSATVEDVKEIYEYAYKTGCKSISIYRDGSKGTQPLNVDIKDTDDFDFDVTKEEASKIQELPYIDSIPKEEFLPKKISLSVQDNQNILIRSSQEQIDVESNKPVLIQDKEDEDDLNYFTVTEIEEKDDEDSKVCCKISEGQQILVTRINGNIHFNSNQPISSCVGDNRIIFYLTGLGKSKEEMNELLEPEDDEVELLQELKDKGIVNIENDKLDEPNYGMVEPDLYEDSQVNELNDQLKETVDNLPTITPENEKALEHIGLDVKSIVDNYLKDNPPKLERVKPDGVRDSRTHSAKIGNVELYITVSYYENDSFFDRDRLCEIFVSSDKEGTEIKGLLSSLSKAISHMLQYGIDPLKIAEMLRNQRYEPQGYVERHPYIKMCTSISDLIARVIEFECGDYSRCQVKPEEWTDISHFKEFKDLYEDKEDEYAQEYNDQEDSQSYLGIETDKGELEFARNLTEEELDFIQNTIKLDKQYTGSECQICHSNRMVQNGTCEVCLDCGNTSGCS